MAGAGVGIARDAILVAGAGPAGLTVARLLALRGRTVAVVAPDAQPNDRLEIIAPAAMPAVQAAGLAELLDDPVLARPCLGIRRRWGGIDDIDDFFRHPGGQGFVIDRKVFDARLRMLAQAAGVQFIAGRVVSASAGEAGVALEVTTPEGPRSISAMTVIDATGRPSAVARRLGAQKQIVDRRVAERRRDERTDDTGAEAVWLRVKGCREGWSYRVAGPGGRSEQWVIRGEAVAKSRATRHRADASAAILSTLAGEGWIAIGDAAASFDPVSSQGLANALATALVVAGAMLSPAGLDEAAQRIYADALTATFRHSEAGRASVYAALTLESAVESVRL